MRLRRRTRVLIVKELDRDGHHIGYNASWSEDGCTKGIILTDSRSADLESLHSAVLRTQDFADDSRYKIVDMSTCKCWICA